MLQKENLMNLFFGCDIINNFVTKEYSKGMVIFNEGDLCDSLGYVVKGEIQITTYTLLEREYNIIILNEGDCFGEMLIFNSRNRYLGNVIANKETSIILISRQELLKLFNKYPIVLSNFLNIISERALAIQERSKILLQTSIKEKILFFLDERSKQDKTKVIAIPSKEKLALILNVPRPSLSRTLILLKKEGYIDYDRNYIIIK